MSLRKSTELANAFEPQRQLRYQWGIGPRRRNLRGFWTTQFVSAQPNNYRGYGMLYQPLLHRFGLHNRDTFQHALHMSKESLEFVLQPPSALNDKFEKDKASALRGKFHLDCPSPHLTTKAYTPVKRSSANEQFTGNAPSMYTEALRVFP